MRPRRTAGIVALALAFGAPGSHADGIGFEGGFTAVYQHALDDRVDDEVTGSADLFLTIPRSNGEWLIYLEASTSADDDGVSSIYPTANADAGSVIDRDGGGGLQISELNYTFRLAEGQTLMLGLIDPSAWLDRSRLANDENLHFLNGSFVNNATIEFPDYTIGGIYRRRGNAARPELVVIVASSDGIADLPDRSYQDLLDLSGDARGLFVGVGASWLRQHYSARLGAWLRTDDHAIAGRPQDNEINYGIYGVLGWQAGRHGLNSRIGLANQEVSVATGFLALAYEYKTHYGLLGAGVAQTFISDDFRQADLDDATDAELFFRIPIGDGNKHLTPSLQYVQNPGFDASGAIADSDAVVVGVRLRWEF